MLILCIDFISKPVIIVDSLYRNNTVYIVCKNIFRKEAKSIDRTRKKSTSLLLYRT